MDDTDFFSSTDGSGIDLSDYEQGPGDADWENTFYIGATAIPTRHDSVIAAGRTTESHSPQFWTPPPLSEDAKQIRVLSLEPAASPLDIVNCNLELTSLDDPSEYLALSYAWGKTKQPPTLATQSDEGAVQIDGSFVDVSPSLRTALSRIREHWGKGELCCNGEQPKLWVDKICVNQSDEVEKSAQVAMMGEIFSKAQAVLIWLGEARRPAGSSTSPEEELLREMDAASSSPIDVTKDLMRPRHDPLSVTRVEDELHNTFGLFEPALEELAKRPWFRRRWTVQEILLQQNRYILLGSRYTRFSNFLSLASCVYKLPGIYSAAGTRPRTRSNSLPKGWSWQSHMLDRRANLLTNMVVFRHMQCTKALDRIYALRAISTDGDQIRVDYKRTVAEVYIEFASIYARSTWLPGLLIAAAGIRPWWNPDMTSDEIERLPSWVPDWRLSRFEPTFPGFETTSLEEYRSGRRLGTCAFARLSMPKIKAIGGTARALIMDCWTTLSCTHLWHEPSCLHCFVNLKAARPRRRSHGLQEHGGSTIYCLLDESSVLFAFSYVHDSTTVANGSDDEAPSYTLMFFLGLKHVTPVNTITNSADTACFNFYLETDDFEVSKLLMRRRKIRVV